MGLVFRGLGKCTDGSKSVTHCGYCGHRTKVGLTGLSKCRVNASVTMNGNAVDAFRVL